MRITLGRLGLLVGLQLTVPGYGQPAGRVSDVPNQPPNRTVTGTVINSVSGLPVRQALVQMFGNSPATVLTGPDGRFQLNHVPEGQILLFVQKPGFFDASSIPGASGTPGSLVTVGSGKNDFRMTLYPAARIVGRATDADGEGVENISIQILSEQIAEGRKLSVLRSGANTDDDGFFRIDGLTPGRYKVFANGHLLPRSSWNAPPEVSVPAYYPDSRDLASAQQIEVRAGQEFRADFHLRSERGFRVVAAVSGMPDRANVGFSFEDASGQGVAFGPTSFDQSKAQFVAEAVSSGTWKLILSANDSQANSYELRQEIVVDDADVTDLQFRLHPLASIPVKVNHATNTVQPSSETDLADTSLNASLISVEPSRYVAYGRQALGSPPVGAFVNVSAGKNKLNMQPSGNECLESAWYGGVDLTRDFMVVGSGEYAQALTINLRADCASLTVKLQSEGQTRSGFVLIVPTSGLAEPAALPVTAPTPIQPTNVSIPLTLSPGSYQVFAFSSLDGLEYANPEALRGYPSQTVNLDPGQKAELTLELIERKGG
jgi:hypothetical protein